EHSSSTATGIVNLDWSEFQVEFLSGIVTQPFTSSMILSFSSIFVIENNEHVMECLVL
ncbi:hypothetical protein HAX54_012779, partial [Datura stramonium]|nr:hypothetical protein [Datura stramonium]